MKITTRVFGEIEIDEKEPVLNAYEVLKGCE